jgi:hypothetical protein
MYPFPTEMGLQREKSITLAVCKNSEILFNSQVGVSISPFMRLICCSPQSGQLHILPILLVFLATMHSASPFPSAPRLSALTRRSYPMSLQVKHISRYQIPLRPALEKYRQGSVYIQPLEESWPETPKRLVRAICPSSTNTMESDGISVITVTTEVRECADSHLNRLLGVAGGQYCVCHPGCILDKAIQRRGGSSFRRSVGTST